mgnify:CR=1 FL=1
MYPFTSAEELISYVSGHPAILVAINAEKILHATDELKAIYNRTEQELCLLSKRRAIRMPVK